MTETNGFQKTTLDNGLRVLTSEMHHTRSVTVSIYIGVGSRYESAEQAGISHLIEHLVFKGTKRRPTPLEISGTIEGVGGVINAETEQEFTVYWCKVAEADFQVSLDLLIDMLRNSLFDPESVDRERMVVVEELNMINDYPGSKVDSLIDEMLWPDHPMGRDIGGTKESVMEVTRDMILDYLASFYTPFNIVISVAGSVSHQEVVRQVEARSKRWRSGKKLDWTPVTHTQSAPQVRLEYQRTEQAHLCIALPGVPLGHPSQYPLDLLSVILGEGMSSRLFVEVRENKGLAYDVHSGVAHFQDTGAFAIAAGVDPKRVYDAVQTILREVSIVKDGVPEEEVEKAKRLVAGRLLLRMEDTRVVSGWMGSQELLQGRVLDLDEVVERVNRVTPDDIREVANDVLVTDKLNFAMVGPSRGERRLRRLLRL